METRPDAAGHLARWEQVRVYPEAHDGFMAFLDRTLPEDARSLCDLGCGLGLMAQRIADEHDRFVWGVDASQGRILAGKDAGIAVELVNLAVTMETVDVFAGLLKVRGTDGIVACRALAEVLGRRGRKAGRDVFWARWWSETVQGAGVRYLWTEGLDGSLRHSLPTVVEEVRLLTQVGWRLEATDERRAFLSAKVLDL
jgi:hypothetical protein